MTYDEFIEEILINEYETYKDKMTYKEFKKIYKEYYEKQYRDYYNEISYYIKEQVSKYKKEITDYMDAIKLLVFSGLIAGISNINDKLDNEYKKYQKRVSSQENKAINKVEILSGNNKMEIINPTVRPMDYDKINQLIEILDIKGKMSKKTASDLYLKRIKDYYKKTYGSMTKGAEYIDKNAYLSAKLSKFDKIEKVIRYRNGSYYSIDTYNSMLYNTELLDEAWKQTILNADNNDLVFVEPHLFSCPNCQQYQGKILSLTGATPGYTTLEEAMADGLKHPNCTHGLTNYYGQPETNIWTGEEWVEKYDVRQKINGLTLKRSRLKSEREIFKQLEDYSSIDKINKKISKINSEIKALR